MRRFWAVAAAWAAAVAVAEPAAQTHVGAPDDVFNARVIGGTEVVASPGLGWGLVNLTLPGCTHGATDGAAPAVVAAPVVHPVAVASVAYALTVAAVDAGGKWAAVRTVRLDDGWQQPWAFDLLVEWVLLCRERDGAGDRVPVLGGSTPVPPSDGAASARRRFFSFFENRPARVSRARHGRPDDRYLPVAIDLARFWASYPGPGPAPQPILHATVRAATGGYGVVTRRVSRDAAEVAVFGLGPPRDATPRTWTDELHVDWYVTSANVGAAPGLGHRGEGVLRALTALGPCVRPTFSEPYAPPGCDFTVDFAGHNWTERPELVVSPVARPARTRRFFFFGVADPRGARRVRRSSTACSARR